MSAKIKNVTIGVDLGKKRDHTAICSIEKWQNYSEWPYEGEPDGDPYFKLKAIERLPLDVDYDVQVEVVNWFYNQVQEQYKDSNLRINLVCDATGVGGAMYDHFKKRIPRSFGICFHGGFNVSREKGIYNVPQMDIVTILQVCMQSQKILFASDIEDLEGLKKELMAFTYKINADTGHTSFEAYREKDHDDRVYSIAAALWFSSKALREIKPFSLPPVKPQS